MAARVIEKIYPPVINFCWRVYADNKLYSMCVNCHRPTPVVIATKNMEILVEIDHYSCSMEDWSKILVPTCSFVRSTNSTVSAEI